MNKRKTYAVKTTKQTMNRLEGYANTKGISKTEAITQLINQGLRQPPSPEPGSKALAQTLRAIYRDQEKAATKQEHQAYRTAHQEARKAYHQGIKDAHPRPPKATPKPKPKKLFFYKPKTYPMPKGRIKPIYVSPRNSPYNLLHILD